MYAFHATPAALTNKIPPPRGTDPRRPPVSGGHWREEGGERSAGGGEEGNGEKRKKKGGKKKKKKILPRLREGGALPATQRPRPAASSPPGSSRGRGAATRATSPGILPSRAYYLATRTASPRVLSGHARYCCSRTPPLSVRASRRHRATSSGHRPRAYACACAAFMRREKVQHPRGNVWPAQVT